MGALSEVHPAVRKGGMYVVAKKNGYVRAQVDADLVAAIPRIRHVIACVAHALYCCLEDEGWAVSVRFERHPGAADARIEQHEVAVWNPVPQLLTGSGHDHAARQSVRPSEQLVR